MAPSPGREVERETATWWMIQSVDYFEDDDDAFDFPCFLQFMMERRSNPPPKSPERDNQVKFTPDSNTNKWVVQSRFPGQGPRPYGASKVVPMEAVDVGESEDHR